MWVWEGFYLEDPCELTFANTLLLSNAAISLGNAFINLEISSEYIMFFTLWSFFLSSLFISLQINKEFRILATPVKAPNNMPTFEVTNMLRTPRMPATASLIFPIANWLV